VVVADSEELVTTLEDMVGVVVAVIPILAVEDMVGVVVAVIPILAVEDMVGVVVADSG